MNRNSWKKKLVMATVGGAFLLQVTSCAGPLLTVTAAASTITAGGVLYLVSRVIGN